MQNGVTEDEFVDANEGEDAGPKKVGGGDEGTIFKYLIKFNFSI